MRTTYHPMLFAAAQELCRIRKLDPDAQQKYHDASAPVSRWSIVAEEIVRHLEIRKALMAAGIHGIDQIPDSVAPTQTTGVDSTPITDGSDLV